MRYGVRKWKEPMLINLDTLLLLCGIRISNVGQWPQHVEEVDMKVVTSFQ